MKKILLLTISILLLKLTASSQITSIRTIYPQPYLIDTMTFYMYLQEQHIEVAKLIKKYETSGQIIEQLNKVVSEQDKLITNVINDNVSLNKIVARQEEKLANLSILLNHSNDRIIAALEEQEKIKKKLQSETKRGDKWKSISTATGAALIVSTLIAIFK